MKNKWAVASLMATLCLSANAVEMPSQSQLKEQFEKSVTPYPISQMIVNDQINSDPFFGCGTVNDGSMVRLSDQPVLVRVSYQVSGDGEQRVSNLIYSTTFQVQSMLYNGGKFLPDGTLSLDQSRRYNTDIMCSDDGTIAKDYFLHSSVNISKDQKSLEFKKVCNSSTDQQLSTYAVQLRLAGAYLIYRYISPMTKTKTFDYCWK